ncbi:hypothetical protein P3W45_001498 [Vairimorpha bombi]|jgi:small-conductance mechanosensitive channel
MNIPFIICLSLELILLGAFHYFELKIKRLLFIPLTSVHISIWYFIYVFRESHTFNVYIKICFRLFKIAFFYLFFYTLRKVIYIKYANSIDSGVLIIAGFDLFRAFLYEIVSLSFNSRITNGIFEDILLFEPFTIKTLKNRPTASTDMMSIQEFYKRGRPEKLDNEMLFDLWNDESVKSNEVDKNLPVVAYLTEEDKILQPEAQEISNEARLFNKSTLTNKIIKRPFGSPYKQNMIDHGINENDFDIKTKPETYLFNKKKDEEPVNSATFLCDSDEVVSDSENEPDEVLNEHQRKDHEANLWILINEEIRKAQLEQPKPGRITRNSLKQHFNKDADLVFRILSFKRTEELNYTVFRDNIRQINNERDNLYTAIDCNRSLLSKIYYTLIVIECLVVYWFISNWLEIQPLLVKLCIPIFILPAFPSLKLIMESFFFIVYSHPYDPGDRILLDDENYIVRDISLLTTTLIRWDGFKCTIANVIMKDKSITNVRRSSSQTWNLELLINSRTSDKRLDELQFIFNKLLEEDKSYAGISMYTTELRDSSYLVLNILVRHNYNFQNGFLMWNNHTKFLRILSASFSVIGIKYLPLPQDVLLIYKL